MVKNLNNTLYSIMLRKLVIAIGTAIVIAIMLLSILGQRVFNSYLTGFLLGSLNMILLSIELNIVVNKSPGRIAIIHFVFFMLRYLLIFYLVYRLVAVKNYEVLSTFGGLLTINASIVLTPLVKGFIDRKEG